MWKIIYFIMKMLPGHYAKMAMWVAMENRKIAELDAKMDALKKGEKNE